MPTDIDRLHDVIEGKSTGRQCGKTYARCHELAAQVTLGNVPLIIVVISHCRDVHYLLPMIYQVFDEYQIQYKRFNQAMYRLETQNCCIKFVVADDLAFNLRGLDNHVIVYMRHWD